MREKTGKISQRTCSQWSYGSRGPNLDDSSLENDPSPDSFSKASSASAKADPTCALFLHSSQIIARRMSSSASMSASISSVKTTDVMRAEPPSPLLSPLRGAACNECRLIEERSFTSAVNLDCVRLDKRPESSDASPTEVRVFSTSRSSAAAPAESLPCASTSESKYSHCSLACCCNPRFCWRLLRSVVPIPACARHWFTFGITFCTVRVSYISRI
mmetsp:Transcript_71304/g.158490  ORF Transcript_71304/g.158490 Transcript_71304/m.158490 type:complete len:216 (-) Transcript_71304:378-1025(-)